MSKKIIAEFPEETQVLLHEVDRACASAVSQIKEEASIASLANEELKVNLETLVWLKLAKAYGILFNRAVDIGWVKGVLTESK